MIALTFIPQTLAVYLHFTGTFLYRTEVSRYSGPLTSPVISSSYLYVYVICDLKLCVKCIELGNGASLATAMFGGKTGLVTSVDQRQGIRINRYSSLCLIHFYSPK
jgi:hypothetical protein